MIYQYGKDKNTAKVNGQANGNGNGQGTVSQLVNTELNS